jgi:hypothetical protein
LSALWSASMTSMRWGVKRCPFLRRVWWQLIAGGYYSRAEELLQQVANAIKRSVAL